MKFDNASATSWLTCALVAALSACGGGGGGGDATTPAPPPPPPPPPATAPVLSANPLTLVDGGTIGKPFWPAGSAPGGGQGAPVDGVNCLVTENYHMHAHLAIIRNGEMLAIPNDVGMQGCAYELHTHDQSGVIHVETSAYRKFTLGQFFSVWGQPLTSASVAGITGLPLAFYINDGTALVEYKGDPAQIELTGHRSITIQVGTALTEIPSYKWDPSL